MIYRIAKEEIENSLQQNHRQYLTGDLKKPQELRHIPNPNVEIGMTQMHRGEKEGTHYHKFQWEFVYVLEGTFMCRDVNTEEKYTFVKGDFFVIENNTKYSQEAITDCLLYFVKYPALNDKLEL